MCVCVCCVCFALGILHAHARADIDEKCFVLPHVHTRTMCHNLVLMQAARSIVTGRSVLELGAGLGLASIVCAHLGAAQVTATDRPEFMELIQRNVDRNCYGAVKPKVIPTVMRV